MKKSDSLVSPYTGVITAEFTQLDKSDNHVISQYDYEVRLAYSDGTWRISELRAQPGVMTDGTLMTYGWHTFTADNDGYKAFAAFQTCFHLKQ